MKKQVLALSGAADKIGFLFGFVFKKWIRNESSNYEAYVGTSSGAITQFALMCGDMNKAKETILEFTPKKHIFGYNPFGIRGISIAAKEILFPSKVLGLWEFNKLEQTLRALTNKDKFDNYSGAPVFVGVANKKAEIRYYRIDVMTYEKAIQKVIESSSVQLFVKSKSGLADGGLVDHIGNEFLAKKYKYCDVVSVFAREEDEEVDEMPNRPLAFIAWLIEVFMMNISKNNETETDEICTVNGTKQIKYFMTSKVIKGMFRIKKGDNQKLFDMGYNLPV